MVGKAGQMDQRRRIIINVVSNYITFVIFGISNLILLGGFVRRRGRGGGAGGGRGRRRSQSGDRP